MNDPDDFDDGFTDHDIVALYDPEGGEFADEGTEADEDDE